MDQNDRVGEGGMEGTGKAKLGKQVEMFAEPGQDFDLLRTKREEQMEFAQKGSCNKLIHTIES